MATDREDEPAGAGPFRDPTPNVLDLVAAESKYQDAMRDADRLRQDDLRAAEAQRLDDLAALKTQYDTRIAENLRVEVKTTSEIISTQLIKETTSLSSQISVAVANFSAQITSLNATFTTQLSALATNLSPRIDRLEQAQLTSAGRASVADPQVSAAIDRMNAAILLLQTGGSAAGGRSMGQGQLIGWLFTAVIAGASLVALFVKH